MPSRRDIFVNGGIYHIYNKSIDNRLIFTDRITDYFFELLKYYRSIKADLRYSRFVDLPESIKQFRLKEIYSVKYFRIEILAYCLMPNHFHLLIKQKLDNGLIRFMSNILNSYTRYFNTLEERKGPIFLPQFRSRAITSREQLIHISRYMHLNPYTSGIVDTIDDIENYVYSSFKDYVNDLDDSLVNTDIILSEFNGSKEKYQKFVLSNAEYQKTLEYCKYTEKLI